MRDVVGPAVTCVCVYGEQLLVAERFMAPSPSPLLLPCVSRSLITSSSLPPSSLRRVLYSHEVEAVTHPSPAFW